jgi:asparagine N-glycosylation enzyme membrane subunit Stt3
LPLIAYYYHAFASDPVFRYWSTQNILLSPPPVHLLMGYGIVLALAVTGVIFVFRQRNEQRLFLVGWVSIALLLMYAPFKLQRRMVEGLHVPLCVLATIGLFEYVLPAMLRSGWLERIAQWRGYETRGLRQLLVFSLVAATFPSTLFLAADSTLRAMDSRSALFYTTEEMEAIDWLKHNTRPTDTVLASYEMGRLIPARAGNRVFMGHFIETVEVDRKRELAATFFQADTSDAFRRDLLEEYGIVYLFHGPREEQMGGFDPSDSPFLTLSYSNSEVRIYRVLR